MLKILSTLRQFSCPSTSAQTFMVRTSQEVRSKRVPIGAMVLSLGLLCATVVAAEPAKDASEIATPIKQIRIVPENALLSGARAVQGFRVEGVSADGKTRDVTALCEFRSSDIAVAEISAEGLLTPQANGSLKVAAVLGDKTAEASVQIGHLDDNAYNFQNDVLPVMEKLGCNQMGCHGSPKGKKRLQLSLFSADPHGDFVQITDAKKELVDPKNPARSLLLLKAICEVDHGGSDLTYEGDPEYNVMLEWIAQGAPESRPNDPKLERVEVYPTECTLIPGEQQHLLVEAYYSDGTVRDVTNLAWYRSSETAVAKIDEEGHAEVAAYGEAAILVRFGGLVSSCLVTAAQPTKVPYPDVPVYNRIDELVDAKLKSLNIIPSGICSDEEFLRRVSLDVIGILPTADEARTFLADTSADKRTKLIDALLSRPEYADFYAVKWGDILQINRDEPARLQDKGMWTYYRWLWTALDENKPMDQFVRELLTARGSAYENGPANFFRVGEGPQGMAEHASTAFLGVRLDCAHCHNHPFEQFTLDDNLGMAAFFSQVRSKRSLEQDEEIIYTLDSGSVSHPDTKERSSPMFLGGSLLAPEQKLAAQRAEADKAAAEKTAAQKAAQAKKVTDAAAAYKKSSDRLIADKRNAAKKAADSAAAAKATADKAVAEKSAAQQAVKVAQQSMDRANAQMAEAQKAMADAQQLASVSDAQSDAEAQAALKAAEEQMKQAEAAVAEAAQNLESADTAMNNATSAAQQANDKAAAAAANAGKLNADVAAAAKSVSEKTAVLKAELDKANAEKSAAEKQAAQLASIHRQAVAQLTAMETTGDLRSQLVDWIVAEDNPYFARNMSNRVWAWLLGRGIVNEPDDFRSTNPPSNPELLDYLAESFFKSGFDTKALFREILNSRTYQLTSQPNEWNKADRIHYSHYQLKRLSAEQLAEAICQTTDVAEKYSGLPPGTRATQLPDVSMRSEFLDLFGRPKRATPVESERTCETHIGQSLQMISS
ncbi:MAG: DUF1549 domain-containing protein, partial [Planctomycetaceae bacterium]|nr:DUF1549 domain-containing protein [Planctomycetaceae bacterium]